MTVANKEQAFTIANGLVHHDYDYDVQRSKKAGYPIYFTTMPGINEWISDLGNRLEVNLCNGRTFNIWVKDYTEELRQNMVNVAKEAGYTAF